MTDEATPSRPSAGAQESRTRVQGVVEGSPSPVTVEEIAERTGLHANTIRGHLDVLLAGGAIERVPADFEYSEIFGIPEGDELIRIQR